MSVNLLANSATVAQLVEQRIRNAWVLNYFTEKRPLLQMALYPELAYPEHHFQPVLRMSGSHLATVVKIGLKP